MPSQLQFLDDGRPEKALEVAAAGELEAGDELLRHGGASDDVAALEDGDGEAAAGEVGGGGEAVVPAADDERVPALVLEVEGAGGGAVADGGEGPPPHLLALAPGHGPPLSWRESARGRVATQ